MTTQQRIIVGDCVSWMRTLPDAMLLVIVHLLPVWLPAVAIGFAAGWFARRRK